LCHRGQRGRVVWRSAAGLSPNGGVATSRIVYYVCMQLQKNPTEMFAMPRFSVDVDFVWGTVSGFSPLSESLVEFIQEDRVTATDDLAMVMAEALAHYLADGEVSPKLRSMLVDTVAAIH
jgi:hypothetical protein